MTSTDTLRADFHDDGLAVLTLCQPARGNPIDGAFAADLARLCAELAGLAGLRAVLVRAEGAHFSYGGDLKAFRAQIDHLAPLVRAWTTDLHAALLRLWQLPVPVVAAVQGYAMGGAASLAAGCDVVIAGTSARIGSAFAQLGFSCDSGSSVTLSARMGLARARRFVLLAEVLGADEALRAGLFDRIVADARLPDEALALAHRLAAGPTLAYGEIKRLFGTVGTADIAARLEDEAVTLMRISETADAREGVGAKLERRAPRFGGR